MKTRSSSKPATRAAKPRAAVEVNPPFLDKAEAEAINAFRAGHYRLATEAEAEKLFPRKTPAAA